VLPGKKYTPDEIVGILLRRKWLVLIPLALGIVASVVVAKHIRPSYRSETSIMVMPQRISDSYVKATITSTLKVEDRLPSISGQILSRSRLERIITELNLYSDLRARGVMEDVVQRMRGDVSVELEGKESFRVSYVSNDARLAQKVTERLASWAIEENQRDREHLAESTDQFLGSQLADAKRRLVEHEKKLEEYRHRYDGQLPTQLQGNLQAIANAQLQLQAASETLNRARERRLLIERQLADAEAPPLAMVSPEPGQGGTAAESAPMTTAQQLEVAQNRLAAFKLRFTADHPDVRALERTIRDLQAKLDEEAKHPAPAAPKVVTPAEAARRKKIGDLRAELEVIDHQLNAGQAEEARLKGIIAAYQAKVDAVPSRESELVELMRDYSTLQATYANLLQKQEDSKLAANLERRQIGEQFRIVDPASLPERPSNQSKRLMASAGATVAGLALGLGLIAFLEFRDSTFKAEEDVLRVLTLPVLALVPLIASDNEREVIDRRKRWMALVLTAGVVGIGSAAIAIWRLWL
jgi:polysaccharide chain length determinant protein (PEP-CTERM system associated)